MLLSPVTDFAVAAVAVTSEAANVAGRAEDELHGLQKYYIVLATQTRTNSFFLKVKARPPARLPLCVCVRVVRACMRVCAFIGKCEQHYVFQCMRACVRLRVRACVPACVRVCVRGVRVYVSVCASGRAGVRAWRAGVRECV